MTFDDAVAARLDAELIIWMTTVTPGGMPQTSPVWFLRDGDEILVYSKDDTARIRNLAANPRTSLHLDGDGRGGAVVVLEGKAHRDDAAPTAAEVTGYVAKYRALMNRNGWTPEQFAVRYPIAYRIRPKRLRAWGA
jgi:PPOX class probable F420-dependent enzyme